MSRPKLRRKIANPPNFKGFQAIGMKKKPPVTMELEEYESIKLCDFDFMGQVDASIAMGISRPTFARIYESARRKVAKSFVTGCPIIFEGGTVYFDSEWYCCNDCGCLFNHPTKENMVNSCALCGSKEIQQYKDKPE